MESKFCPQCGNPCADVQPAGFPKASEPVTGQKTDPPAKQDPSPAPGQKNGPIPGQEPGQAPGQMADQNATIAQIVGKNTQYYLSQFHAIKASGKGKINWASFFFTIIHAAYRNVWKEWLKAVYIPLIAEAVCIFAAGISLNIFLKTFSFGSLMTVLVLFLLAFAASGIWFFIASLRFSLRFNSVYLKHVEEKMAKNDIRSDISGVRAALTALAYSAAVALLLSLAWAPVQAAFFPADSYEDYNFYEGDPYGNYDSYDSYNLTDNDNYSLSDSYSAPGSYGFSDGYASGGYTGSDSYSSAENNFPENQEPENIQGTPIPDTSEAAIPPAETPAAYEETAAPAATPLFGTYESSLDGLGNAEIQIEYISGDDMIWASFSGASGMDAGSATGYLYETEGQVYDFYADGDLGASMRLSYDGYGTLTVSSMDGNTFGGLNFPGFSGTYTQTAAYELP